MTDLGRLHKVALGEISGRGIGKTYLSCHELCGTIELGVYDTILVNIVAYRDLNYILYILEDIFKEHEIDIIEFNKNEKFIKVTYDNTKLCKIKFIVGDISKQEYGYNNIGYVDFRDYYIERPNQIPLISFNF